VTPAGSLRAARKRWAILDLLVTLAPGKHTAKTVEAASEYILKYPEIDQRWRTARISELRFENRPTSDVRLLEKQALRSAALFHGIQRAQRRAARAREQDGTH